MLQKLGSRYHARFRATGACTGAPPPVGRIIPGTSALRNGPHAGDGHECESSQVRPALGISGDGLLVIDTQFADTAPNLLAGLKERSPRQIDVLINSHHHPDHTGGNGVLRPAVKQIVAHVRSSENQKAQAERAKAPTTLPDVTFPDTWSVTLGDETIRAKHWGPAHTGGDVAIHFEQANVVHLGDLLNNRGYPVVDAPAGASVHGWMQVLEKMAAAYPADALYVFGHAEAGHPFIGTRTDLHYQRDYFTAVVAMARDARRSGKSRDELATVR